MTLSQQLREARDRALLSQEELARVLGCSTRSVQAWETGREPKHPRHRRAVAEFLNDQKAAA